MDRNNEVDPAVKETPIDPDFGRWVNGALQLKNEGWYTVTWPGGGRMFYYDKKVEAITKWKPLRQHKPR